MPRSELAMTSTCHPIAIQPLPELISHLRVVFKKDFMIPILSEARVVGFCSKIFRMQDTLHFSFDISWCEREIEVLHVRCVGSNLLRLSQADEAAIAHGNSTGLSTFEPTLQGGRCNSMTLCDAQNRLIGVISVLLDGQGKCLIPGEGWLSTGVHCTSHFDEEQ